MNFEEKEIEESVSQLRLLINTKNKLSSNDRKALQTVINHYDYISQNDDDIDAAIARRSDSNIQINWGLLYISIILICLSSFNFGYITIQTTLVIDKTGSVSKGALNHDYNLTAMQKSLLQSSSLIGASIGSFLIWWYPSVRYGRKTILWISNIPIIIGCISSIISVNKMIPILVLMGSILEGIGFGISSCVVPILLGELSPKSVRIYVTSFHQMFVVLGMFIASINTILFINYKHGWKYIISFGMIISFIQLIFFYKIPESPRWLIAKQILLNNYDNDNDNNNDNSQAKEIMTRFVNKNEYKKTKDYIWANVEREVKQDDISQQRFSNLLDYKNALFIGVLMNMFQQFTGCNVIFYHSQTILQKHDGSGISIDTSVFMIYSINLIATIIYMICVKIKHIKNKTLMYIGTVTMLFSVAFLGYFNTDFNDNQHIIDKLSISQLPFYIFGYAISLAPFTWIINSELFPFCNRIRYGSLCIFIQWLCNALLSLFADKLINHWLQFSIISTNTSQNGAAVLFFIFTFIIFCCILFIWKYVPETKGKSLESAVKKYNKYMVVLT